MKVGKTFSYGNGRLDDNKSLAELGFQVKIICYKKYLYITQAMFPSNFSYSFYVQIGDYLDVAIL